jgi:hypothetical protein
MPDPRFDPSDAVTFDLAHGLVHLEGAPARVLVPAEALVALCAATDEATVSAFGRAIGQAMGRRAAGRLSHDGGIQRKPPEVVVDHLGGELALAGLGCLGIERWGNALVMVVDHCPLEAAGDRLVSAVLGAALVAATGSEAHTVLLGREGTRARFLLSGSKGVERVRAFLAEGRSWPEALVELHSSAARGDA